MLFNVESVYSVLWAAALGIIVAVVYINIQRGIISKFICGLIEAKAFDVSNALKLSDLGISGFSERVVVSAVKNQHGLNRIICSETPAEKKKLDEAEVLLGYKKSPSIYWISSETDVQSAKEKYYFSPLSPIKIIVMVLAVIISVMIAGKLFEVFNNYLSSPDDEKKQEIDLDEREDSSSLNKDVPIIPYVPSVPSNSDTQDTQEDTIDSPKVPTIPLAQSEG